MPKGIVIQLQAEAMDESADIEVLLRKAYLVARKLRLNEFEKWIKSEQDGYSTRIPDYRIVYGEVVLLDEYSGWIPLVAEGEVADLLCKMPLGNSISFISDLYKNDNGVVMFSIVNGDYINALNKVSGYQTQYCFRSTKTEIHRIISAVRNKILEWSLLLEENGIKGEGLMFTEEEKRSAETSTVINNYINNFYSSVNDTNIEQGTSYNSADYQSK